MCIMEFNEHQYTKSPQNNVPFHTNFHELAGDTKKCGLIY
jgi:hypothetical protein